MKSSTPHQFQLFSLNQLTADHASLDMIGRFIIFDALNPWVYQAMKARALEFLKYGDAKIGIQCIIEDIRWHVWRKTEGLESFKINNSFAPYYARKLLACEDRLSGRIEVRKMKIEFDYIKERVIYHEIIQDIKAKHAGKSAK